MQKFGVALLLAAFVFSGVVASANEETATFTWDAFDHSPGVLTYTLYHVNVATGDSTHVWTFEADGAMSWMRTFSVTGGETYDVTVRGYLPDGTGDSCTQRIDVPLVYVENNGCACALIP